MEYSPEKTEKVEPFYEDMEIPSTSNKRKSKNDRRFSDEQIKSLESIFKMETKLESRKKQQLARDLGLQPRQVAIWFQNRRARWKSKQIEQDYKVLRANYDNLRAKFDGLKREKQGLQMQLQDLSDVVHNLDEDDEACNRDAEMNGNIPDISAVGMHQSDRICAADDGKMIASFGKAEVEEDLVSWGEGEEGEIHHLASPEAWCYLSSGGLFDQSSGSASNWWEDE